MRKRIVLSSGILGKKEQISIRDQIEKIKSSYLENKKAVRSPDQVVSSYLVNADRVSIKDQIEQVASSYLVKDEVPVNITLTQEAMAVALADDMFRGKPLPPARKQELGNMLHESIRKWVYQNANRYAKTCPDSVDDLVQDCFLKMMRKLYLFDPNKSRFTTWVWHVCRSVLSKKYRQGLKGRDVILSGVHLLNEDGTSRLENLPSQPDEGSQIRECPGLMACEITDAIRDLENQFPIHQSLIRAIFGDTQATNFAMAGNISIADAARSIGMEYSQAHSCYLRVIRPFMQKKLEGCYTP